MKPIFGKRVIGAAFGILTLMSVSHAQAQQNVKGVGSLTCGEFYKVFEDGTDTDKGQLVGTLFSWVQGYASGKNLERNNSEQKDLSTLEPELVLTQVNRYCAINAGFEIYSIAEIIYAEMPAFAEASV